MNRKLNFILVLFVVPICTLNVTEETDKITVTEKVTTSATIDKNKDQQADLIKQIMSARTTNSQLTSNIFTTTMKSQEKEIHSEEIDKRENTDLAKLEKEGITIEEILKRCREMRDEQKTTPNPNLQNQETPSLAEINKIAKYILSLQKDELNSITFQNPAKQPEKPNFIQSSDTPKFYEQLINQYYPNRIMGGNVDQGFISPNLIQNNEKKQQEVQKYNKYLPASTDFNIPTQPKPVKMVPTLLQKVYLKDGQVVYYLPRKSISITPNSDNFYGADLQKYSQDYQAEATNNQGQEPEIHKPLEHPHPPNLYQLPTQVYENDKKPTTSEPENTTKTPTDIPKYYHQLKFVVPFRSCKDETPTRYPDQFDPYAYLAKHMQPSEVNLRVPYVPTFHAIKTLTIPSGGNLANVDVSNEK